MSTKHASQICSERPLPCTSNAAFLHASGFVLASPHFPQSPKPLKCLRRPFSLCISSKQPSQISPQQPAPRRRKPSGYWVNMDNLQYELHLYLQDSGAQSPYTMPKARDLRAAGRSDIDNAIAKMGGYPAIAELLGWSVPFSRRPTGYWKDFSNLQSELLAFIQLNSPHPQSPTSSYLMPTQRELRAAKRSDLADAIERHGGFITVAEQLNLKRRAPKKAKHYWKDWSKVEVEVRAFVRQRNEAMQDGTDAQKRRIGHRMPSQREMRAAGRADLAEAISDYHGGFRTAARKLGFSSKKKDDFFYTHFHNVAAEVYTFVHGLGGNTDLMPTTTVLKAEGRTDIAAAIVKHGGMSEVSKRLGLQYRLRTKEIFKDWELFRRALLSFMNKHAEPDVIPSSRTLLNYGRVDLYQALLHHGGVREVSDRMGLKRNYWQDFRNVGSEVLQFISMHGTEGVLPTEQEFRDVGRMALNLAVGKFGHNQVAQRLGLLQPCQSTQKAFDSLLNSSMHFGDDDDDVDSDDDNIGELYEPMAANKKKEIEGDEYNARSEWDENFMSSFENIENNVDDF